MEITQYGIHDFVLTNGREQADSFRLQLSATFRHASGTEIERVPAFYNGQGAYVVRFSPTLPGRWQGTTESEDATLADRSLGPIECVPAADGQAHGGVMVDPTHPHRFSFQDGTPFIYLGFECDWLFAYYQADPALCRQHVGLIADRGFNAVVMNIYAHTGFSTPGARFEGALPSEGVYGPPQQYVFGGTNEAPDHAVLNTAFFEAYDGLINLLQEHGVIAHLMLQVQNKHVNWPDRHSPEDDAYWRYVVARYQAFPNVIWDVGKESYNLRAETGSHVYALSRIQLIRETDAYGRMVTIHDAEAGSAGRVSEADLASDFVSDQIHLSDVGRYNREAIRKQEISGKPYLNIEYGYELGVEPLKTYQSRTTAPWQDILKWTYALLTAGAYACYYYSNTSWDLIRFEPEPPGWRRYKILQDLIADLPFNEMWAANDLVDRGTCLAAPGRAYLIFLPEGGDAILDLTAVPSALGPRGQLVSGDHALKAQWTAIYSGETQDVEITTWGWLTTIANPFKESDQPVVVVIHNELSDRTP